MTAFIERLRQNLDRDYGVKTLYIGHPLLAARIPRRYAREYCEEDQRQITSIIEEHREQFRLDEIRAAYIIADETHQEVNPDFFLQSEEETEEEDEEIEEVPGERVEVDESEVVRILDDLANDHERRLSHGRVKAGRRSETLVEGKRGRYVRFKMPDGPVNDVAIAPTLRAAALDARDGRLEVKKRHLRQKVRRRRISTLICLVLDASGSMDSSPRVEAIKKVVHALLLDAYQRRDKVSLITYSGTEAEVIVPFTSSVERAKQYMEEISYGGMTPLAQGMLSGLRVLLAEGKREPMASPIMVLVTDGTANVPLLFGGNVRREISQVCQYLENEGINLMVIDIGEEEDSLARDIAEEAGGRYCHLPELAHETIYNAIKDERDKVTSLEEWKRSTGRSTKD